jgi:hypothetical protein
MRAGIVSPGVQMYMGGGDGVDISLQGWLAVIVR